MYLELKITLPLPLSLPLPLRYVTVYGTYCTVRHSTLDQQKAWWIKTHLPFCCRSAVANKNRAGQAYVTAVFFRWQKIPEKMNLINLLRSGNYVVTLILQNYSGYPSRGWNVA